MSCDEADDEGQTMKAPGNATASGFSAGRAQKRANHPAGDGISQAKGEGTFWVAQPDKGRGTAGGQGPPGAGGDGFVCYWGGGEDIL